jgi:hypothetical protein
MALRLCGAKRARQESDPRGEASRPWWRSPRRREARSDRLTEDAFGAVYRGGVEEVDPQIQRLADEGDGFRFALAEAELVEPAEAELGDADPEPGATGSLRLREVGCC